MKKLILAAAFIGAATVSATAADLAARPYTKAPALAPLPSWTGWYIGVQGGYSEGEANHSIVLDGLGFLNAPYGPTKIKGGNYGGVVGYDWQLSPTWVVGINTEFNGGKIKGLFDNGIAQGFGPGGDDIYQSDVRWFGSTRVKVGAVLPSLQQLLVYATAGVAYADIHAANGDGAQPFSVLDTRAGYGSKTEVGYTVGGGISWWIPGTRFVLTGEGAYYDFGTAQINTVTNTGAPHLFDVKTNFATGRGILSYKF